MAVVGAVYRTERATPSLALHALHFLADAVADQIVEVGADRGQRRKGDEQQSESRCRSCRVRCETKGEAPSTATKQ
ncbi:MULTISPECIES: hypothetical protein [unclassified Streptomyces]|uniref:hypothetical protein n=1 Tax=unclassified Streptomyces TaxID=2593676 RepID=UPI00114D2E1D|nr:hypothetical protein [Streptomyces sp. MnatMP-M77]MYT82474.1 hypothetical protein [Streptomyces sp. SID8364]